MEKNNKVIERLASASVVFVLIALTSCSGDDGGTSLGGVTIPAGEISINSSNVNLVATESTEASERTNTASSVVTESNSVSSTLSARTVQKASSLVNVLASRSASGDGIVVMHDCPNGGTYTSPDTTTGIGDYVYDNCQFSDFAVNGSISIEGTGDLIGGTSFTGSYSYNELTITTNEYTSIYDGILNIVFTKKDGVTEGTYTIPSLTYVTGSQGVRITNYSLTFYEAASEGYVDYNYTISSVNLGGSVSIASTQRFKYYTDIAYDYPYAGQLVISGANNTSARLTVDEGGAGLATDYVTIEIDADGDGVYEEMRQVQWSEL